MERGSSRLAKSVRKVRQAEKTVEEKKESLNPVDVLDSLLRHYLKLSLKETAKINEGVETTVDKLCNLLADKELDAWLDVFFQEYKKAIGI